MNNEGVTIITIKVKLFWKSIAIFMNLVYTVKIV